jgi:lysine 2,3-aminomutase
VLDREARTKQAGSIVSVRARVRHAPIVCDVPFVGKRWVHMVSEYDRERSISYWTKNYRTSIEAADAEALSRTHPYYDPIDTLPESGRRWWAKQQSSQS